LDIEQFIRIKIDGVFNCKNPHFAQVGPNRWCINAWRIRDKRREDYEQCLRKI
jgi:hypothetical protein